MKQLFTLYFIFFSSCILSQDFTSSISKMAFKNGEIYGNLKRCNAPEESLVVFDKIIHQLKLDRLPNDSYIEIYDKSYEEGKQSGLSKSSDDLKDCEKHMEHIKELLMYNESY